MAPVQARRRASSAALGVIALLLALVVAAPQASAQQSLTFTGSANANGNDWIVHTFEAPSPAQIEASLSWGNAAADFNLFLRNPGGEIVSMSTSRTVNPETLAYTGKWAGTWAIAVKARTGSSSYTLTVVPNAVSQQMVFTGTEAFGGGWQAHNFDLAGDTDLDMNLDWQGNANLNLFLRNPAGEIVASASSVDAKPEKIEYRARMAGTWTVAVNSASGTADYIVTVAMGAQASPGTPPPPPPAPAPPAPPPPPPGATSPGTVATLAIEQENPSHSHTRSQALGYAQDFNAISALRFALHEHSAAMQQAHPGLLLSVYLNGVFAQAHEQNSFPDGWYLRDARGQKIQNNWGLWMLDVGLPAVQQNRADMCIQFLRQSGYNGCFLDNLGWGTLWPPSLSGQPINPRTGREYTNQEWMAGTTEIARRTRALAGSGRHIVANGLVSGSKYFDPSAPTRDLIGVSDIALAETFIRTSGMGVNATRGEQAWRQDVDMLIDASRANRRVMVTSKIWRSDATAADVARWHEFALASFMLGDDGSHFFYFSGAERESRMTAHPWWGVNLGPARGSYTRSAEGIYQREYTNGRVLANPTGTPRTVALGGSFRNLRGQWVSSVALPPNSGAVLSTR